MREMEWVERTRKCRAWQVPAVLKSGWGASAMMFIIIEMIADYYRDSSGL